MVAHSSLCVCECLCVLCVVSVCVSEETKKFAFFCGVEIRGFRTVGADK